MITQGTDGVAIRLHAGETTASGAAALRAQEQVFDLLSRRLPVAVTIAGLEATEQGEDLFEQVCSLLAATAAEAEAPCSLVSLVVSATDLSPQHLWSRRCDLLGEGLVFLLVDGQLTRPSRIPVVRRRQDQFWSECWQHRGNTLLRIALASVVSSACPLFALEPAAAILPPHGLQVPPGTAWATMRVKLTDYMDERGQVDTFALCEGVRRCVAYGEQVHDEANWPTAAMRDDSWSNRRLAISVDGIGDLARQRDFDPQSFAALQSLGAILSEVRDVANEYSRQLATENEHAPSLRIAEPDRQASTIVELAGWQSRWQAALKLAATRHRNLLALSPWTVFPSVESADSRYTDLLPLLNHADVLAFPAPPCMDSWNINEFKHFHRRVWAVLEQKDAQQMIAEQV